MKKLSFIALLCATFLLSSCGAFKSYVASYSVGLSAVESPADAKQQFGETKVVTFDEEGISKYRYEDDYIDIVWYVSSKQFNFYVAFQIIGKYLLFINCLLSNSYTISREYDVFRRSCSC